MDQETDQSIIIELLEMVTEASDDEASRYHFQQLAEDNDASDSQVLSVEILDPKIATPLFPYVTSSALFT